MTDFTELISRSTSVYSGFPAVLIPLVRCPLDGGELLLSTAEGAAAPTWIGEGEVVCTLCQSRFTIEQGILNLLDRDQLDEESAHERELRDAEAPRYDLFTPEGLHNEMEMQPTLEALRPYVDGALLELGCGTGRYTLRLAESCTHLLAVDFSSASLGILASRLRPEALVGLVHADITRLAVASRAFARVFSTLVSNLPTPEHRTAMFRLAAEALEDDGHFVFGTHFHGIRDRIRRVPQSGRYGEGGIYRYHFRKVEIEGEARPFFGNLDTHPVRIRLPGARRLGLPVLRLSRMAERIPLISELGELLLVKARQPLRVGAAQRGSPAS